MDGRMSEPSRIIPIVGGAYIALHAWGLISGIRSMGVVLHRPELGFQIFWASKMIWNSLGLAAGLGMLGRRAWAREWAIWSSLTWLVVFFVSGGAQAVWTSWRSGDLLPWADWTVAMIGLTVASLLFFPRPAVTRQFADGTVQTRQLIAAVAALFLAFWSLYILNMNRTARDSRQHLDEQRARFNAEMRRMDEELRARGTLRRSSPENHRKELDGR